MKVVHAFPRRMQPWHPLPRWSWCYQVRREDVRMRGIGEVPAQLPRVTCTECARRLRAALGLTPLDT